ncbi:MAG: hypothetical protein WAT21_11760, partial [Saprospiraceae bacterium]
DFFNDLDSNKVKVINKKTKKEVENWIRYQHYPSNDENRVVNLSSIYKSYGASPGDYVYIEKIQTDNNIHYEIYMKTYQKVCLKYSNSNKAFEILNESEVLKMGILDNDIELLFKGKTFKTMINFSHSKKKRADSPSESRFYDIANLPSSLINDISRDSFVEVSKRDNKYYIEVMDSWGFNKFIK